MKKNTGVIECIEYLSVEGALDLVNKLEDNQSRYIREHINNKPYKIVGTVRRNGFSQNDVNRQWNWILNKIRKKQVQGIVIANMAAVSNDLPDAYRKVGQVIEAGGVLLTVDEGVLSMNIKEIV